MCVRQQPAALALHLPFPPIPPLEQAAVGLILHFPEDSEEAPILKGPQALQQSCISRCVAEAHSLSALQ